MKYSVLMSPFDNFEKAMKLVQLHEAAYKDMRFKRDSLKSMLQMLGVSDEVINAAQFTNNRNAGYIPSEGV